MLINLSNHPYSAWSSKQKKAAVIYGETVDLPFPSVDPKGNEDYIAKLTDAYVQKIENIAAGQHITVHLMGEMTLAFSLVEQLHKVGITCIASTTKRSVIDNGNGCKEATFQF